MCVTYSSVPVHVAWDQDLAPVSLLHLAGGLFFLPVQLRRLLPPLSPLLLLLPLLPLLLGGGGLGGGGLGGGSDLRKEEKCH